MKKRYVVLAVLALLVTAWASVTTYAWFTDRAETGAHRFTSGTLEIALSQPSPGWLAAGEAATRATVTEEAGVAHIGGLQPGDTATFAFFVQSTGTLPLAFRVTPSLAGPLAAGATPCQVSQVRVDGAVADGGTLTAQGGVHQEARVEVDVTLPLGAGSEYQGLEGELRVVVDAEQVTP